MEENNLENILSKAIEMEKTGYDFYKKKSLESKNKITRKTFSFLAERELLHIENISNFYNEYKEKNEFPSIDLDSMSERRKQESDLFKKSIDSWNEKISSDSKDEEALKFALELEKKGYKYYKEILELVEDDKLKKLLKFLLEEEDSHYEEFMKVYEYLTDSSNWYMYEEGSFPQG